jgi:hypothetical protein
MSSGFKQMLLLKILAKQGIIAKSGAKPKSRNWTSGGMKDSNKLVQDYVASIPFDRRLYRQDIEGSIAHARMLAKQGIIAESEADIEPRRDTWLKVVKGNI